MDTGGRWVLLGHRGVPGRPQSETREGFRRMDLEAVILGAMGHGETRVQKNNPFTQKQRGSSFYVYEKVLNRSCAEGFRTFLDPRRGVKKS